MWLVICTKGDRGRFYSACPRLPLAWPGARLRIVGRHSDASEARRIADELEKRRLKASWRRSQG